MSLWVSGFFKSWEAYLLRQCFRLSFHPGQQIAKQDCFLRKEKKIFLRLDVHMSILRAIYANFGTFGKWKKWKEENNRTSHVDYGRVNHCKMVHFFPVFFYFAKLGVYYLFETVTIVLINSTYLKTRLHKLDDVMWHHVLSC